MAVPAENLRTAIKARIKRASAAARTAGNRLDRRQLDALSGIYNQAIDDIQAQIRHYAGSDGSVRLEVMQQLLGQVQNRLDQLSQSRDDLLQSGLQESAQIGAQPFSDAPGFVTRAAEDAVRFVNNFVAADGLQLSDRVWNIDNHTKRLVSETIQRSVIQGHGASQAASDLMARGETVGRDLQSKMNAANADAIASQVGGLFRGDRNPRDNALRLMRTELNRAHGEAYMMAGQAIDDFGGWKFLLSPRHPEPDICDMHAHVNRYGLGPGVYPDRNRTPWPAHPNTLSYIEIVFKDEITQADKDGKEDRIGWLNKQPPGVQEQVLGSRKKRFALEQGILKENEIATPWKVLRQKYEKRGLDPASWGSNEGTDQVTPITKHRTRLPSSAGFKPAKTTSEASKWATDNDLADVADYSGIEVEAANQWNQAIFEHLNEFPELRRGLQFIGTSQNAFRHWYDVKVGEYLSALSARYPDRPLDELRKWARRFVSKPRVPGNVWAYSMSEAPIAGVTINKKWGSDLAKLKKSLSRATETRFHPVGADSVKSIIDHELGHELDKLVGARGDPEITRLFRDWLRRDPDGLELSRYARTNAAEFIAEAWSEYRNNPTPRPLAKKVGDYIQQQYEAKFVK